MKERIIEIKKKYFVPFIFTLLGLLTATLLFLYHQEIIIIRWPHKSDEAVINKVRPQKKQVQLFYWHQERWRQEKKQLIWSDDVGHNATHLMQNLLQLLQEENLISKKASLESALVDSNGQEIYLSFTHTIFEKQQNTYQKWMLIETILKNIREHLPAIIWVRFLIHHQPFLDHEIDLSQPWPINGFLA